MHLHYHMKTLHCMKKATQSKMKAMKTLLRKMKTIKMQSNGSNFTATPLKHQYKYNKSFGWKEIYIYSWRKYSLIHKKIIVPL